MQLLHLLPLFFFSLALGSPSDVLYIQKLNADEAQLLDAKDFAGLVNIFTQNATYKSDSSPIFDGLEDIQAKLPGVLEPITQSAINTESITLLPPFDEQGAAGTATGVLYITVANFGLRNSSTEALFVFGKFEDKYVKTGDFALHGGWRISERVFVLIVSLY